MNIVIIGTSGVGKTTLAKNLAEKLHLKHASLDSMYWQPGWKRPDKDIFRKKVKKFVEKKNWILDGNYNSVRDITWPNADVIIWLDFPLYIALWGAFKRLLSQKQQAKGCQDSLRKAFFTKESIFLWILQSHWRRKKEYKHFMKDKQYKRITFFHLKERPHVDHLLKDIVSSRGE